MHKINKVALFLTSLMMFPIVGCAKEEPQVEKPNLLEKLEEVKNSKNYTVVSQSHYKKEGFKDFLGFAYYNDDSYLFRFESVDDSFTKGYINSDDGIYTISLKDEEVAPGKIDYQSYKNKIKSYWDPAFGHIGLQTLDLKYVKKTDTTYTFKAREFGNKQAIFENTGLNFSYYLSTIKKISCFINDKNNLEFAISIGEFGDISEEIINVNNTIIEPVETFLKNGGRALPSTINPDQAKTIDKINSNNYQEALPPIALEDEEKPQFDKKDQIDQGTIYYHPDYYFIDYSDDYIKYFKLTENADIKDGGAMQIGDDVVEFTTTYDKDGNPIIELEGTVHENTTVPKAVTYLSETQLIKEYAHAQEQLLSLGVTVIPFYEIADFDIAREFSTAIFHLQEGNIMHTPVIMSSHSAGITNFINNELLFVLYSYNNGTDVAYSPLVYEKFGRTDIKFIEQYIKENTK